MQFIYYQKQTVDAVSENNKISGYACPFTNDDCVHLDSLSMTKTVVCNNCENFIHDRNIDKHNIVSALGVGMTMGILINN